MDLKRIDDWHLHITVEGRDRGSLAGFRERCEKLNWKPTVMENMMGLVRSEWIPPYTELLPTLKMRGELGQAIINMHDAAKFWALSGWIVRRMKIEGRDASPDAMYAETHRRIVDITEAPKGWAASRSLISGHVYATYRQDAGAATTTDDKWEHVMYDSNRGMDAAWLASWGALR